MTEQTLIENFTRDIGNYVKNNIEEIREKHPEFRKTMRLISMEMTDYLKDQGRVEIGTKGNMVANNNGKKARRDVRELTENEIVLKEEVRSLTLSRDEARDDRDRLGVMVTNMSVRADRKDDVIAELRDRELRENRKQLTENYTINE